MSVEKIFSLRKGYSFSFNEDGNQISAWFSSISGLEKIYVNDELITSQRNISKNSTNTFVVDGTEYSINLDVVSIRKGPFVCTLSKNGKPYKRRKLVFSMHEVQKSKFNFLLQLVFFIFVGLIFGAAKAYWQLPKESLYLFVAAIFVAVFLYKFKTTNTPKPTIETEKIV